MSDSPQTSATDSTTRTSSASSEELARSESPGTPAGSLPVARPGSDIPYELFLDCVHCGLCTASCPTYAELGNENDSPRGRIYLMRAVTDGRLELNANVRGHLELCLDCRACETACPSGVQYGKLIEPFRVAMEQQDEGSRASDDWFHRWILFGLFPFATRMRKALAPARLAQQLGLHALMIRSGLWKLLPTRLGRMVTLLPDLPAPLPGLPARLPAKGEQRARVALFTGCVSDAIFRPTLWATARVLQENGCEVLIPTRQGCCGAIHFHAGCSEPAREMADTNLSAFQDESLDAILVNVAGCGAMLKDYGHHWRDERQDERAAFAGKVKDVNEFLFELGLRPPRGRLTRKVAYHDACHLGHAQRIKEQPRALLAQIPGLQLVDLAEADMCCGAAGTYNLMQPEMADRLGQRKLANILETGAQVIATANAGCLMQIAREARLQGQPLKLVHPMDLLDLSYRDAMDELD